MAASNNDATPGPADGTGTAAAGPSATTDTPEATPTISLTPPANATPADPSTARRLEAEGELEKALQAYLTISASTASNKAEGVYGAARTLLEPFIAGATPAAAAPAHYLLARAYTALSMYGEALSEYSLYVQSGRTATPYAYLDRARILMDQGQPLTAASEAQIGLNTVPSGSRRTFVLITAQS